jgi:hypothetical protein
VESEKHWNIGILEYWNNGKLGFKGISVFPTIPLFQHSIIPFIPLFLSFLFSPGSASSAVISFFHPLGDLPAAARGGS